MDEKFDPDVNWIFRTRNFQAFELGLDYMNDSQEYLSERIKGNLCPEEDNFLIKNMKKFLELADLFDLVMLKEYFFESLVLLSRILCVDYRILYVRFRMESKKKGFLIFKVHPSFLFKKNLKVKE